MKKDNKKCNNSTSCKDCKIKTTNKDVDKSNKNVSNDESFKLDHKMDNSFELK